MKCSQLWVKPSTVYKEGRKVLVSKQKGWRNYRKVGVSVVWAQLGYLCSGKGVSMEFFNSKRFAAPGLKASSKIERKVEAVRIFLCRNMLKYETVFLTDTTSGCRVTSRKYPALSSCCFSLPSGPFYLSPLNDPSDLLPWSLWIFFLTLFQANRNYHSLCLSVTH